jgi:hypothetical protein
MNDTTMVVVPIHCPPILEADNRGSSFFKAGDEMTNKQMCVIVGAIIIGVLLIIFLPPYLEKADKEAQMERDNSIQCELYKVTVLLNQANALIGGRLDYAEEERQRKAGGCTPE